MAFDFSKLNFFNRLSARSRVAVLLGALVAVIFIVYFGVRLILGPSKTVGPSRVANAPSGLQSIPGHALTPEYKQALNTLNQQTAQQASATGGSSISTYINPGYQQGGNSCIICTDQSANVKNYLDDWVRQGTVSPDIANQLEQLAANNIPVSQYANTLDNLVKQGKLTPEQARQLLDQYTRQHASALLADSAKAMDGMIKSGELPLDVANQLLNAQKNHLSPADYAAELQRLVAEGRLTPNAAKQLLAQYQQQFAHEVIRQSIVILQQMSSAGQITPDVLNTLIPLENQMVPLDRMATTLSQLVAGGKLTPIVSDKILDEYQKQKAEIGGTGALDKLVRDAEAAAYQELKDLVQAGKITPDVGNQLAQLIKKNVSLADYTAAVGQLVQQNQLTPDIAKLKIADYQKVKQLRDLRDQLANLQANNANEAQYTDALKNAVAAGVLTPAQAAQMLQDYENLTAQPPPNVAVVSGTSPAEEAFAALQRRVAAQNQANPATSTPNFENELNQAQPASLESLSQDELAHIQTIEGQMASQAAQLISAWQPPIMQEHKRTETQTQTTTNLRSGGTGSATTTTSTSTSTGAATGPIIIKAGTILFAVLDTAVNSDYPSTPVLATIVAGPFKGAKLLGTLQTQKSVAGQLDRVSLNFTLMNRDEWAASKTVTAYAIDPDTARTVMASKVDYHYLERYGAIMAASFLQGYSNAITQAGTTTFTSAGVSNTRNQLNPSSKIMVGLGQIGQNLQSVTQNYINIPPTVKVNAGVGLGILFMADLT